VIAGNGSGGILFEYNTPSTGNRVQGNFIGTQVDGISPLGNAADGVLISGPGTDDNAIGGTDAGAGNIIAYNGGSGVLIATATGTVIAGNTIVSNGTGGVGVGSGPGTIIAGNTIASNGNVGVYVGSGAGVTITQNSIFGHTGLGIDLNGLGPDLPVITAASSSDSTTTVEVTFATTPDTLFTLEFFANSAVNPSGYGEGERFLGSRWVLTDDLGNAAFTFTFDTAVPVGQFVSATATDPAGNTSGFSLSVMVDSSPGPFGSGRAGRALAFHDLLAATRATDYALPDLSANGPPLAEESERLLRESPLVGLSAPGAESPSLESHTTSAHEQVFRTSPQSLETLLLPSALLGPAVVDLLAINRLR
jgi:parallel beta-helix repeat protein